MTAISRRTASLSLLAILFSSPAAIAQNAPQPLFQPTMTTPIIQTPLPQIISPTPTQAQPQASPSAIPSFLPPGLTAQPGPGQPPGQPATPPPPATPGPLSNWEPRGEAQMKALDKVNARSLTLSARVGQVVKYATLSITVRACLVRPNDQEADAAAYLDITDARPNAPGFRGWMFANEPGIGVLEHPIYDIRLTACRP